ncbi:MAG: tRNA guanosine(34) transglycosylase Tgt [Chloroflexi bacterium]|nr:tRNA guanosine(34) transglycosylase Tgt [Chloroflexota bacterium]
MRDSGDDDRVHRHDWRVAGGLPLSRARERAVTGEGQPAGRALEVPVFLPDATRAAVRSVSTEDLRSVGVKALMVNTFHLMRRPGMRVVQRSGGIHRFMGWDGPIMSDSGGFQVYSLIRQSAEHGVIRQNEVIFREPSTGEKWRLTPERVIQLQMQLGSDIMICLDDCTGAEAPEAEQEQSVERTIRWARRCKEELERMLGSGRQSRARPHLFAVVQGGASEVLRRQCAAALVSIGFDGYGFGGWPIAPDGSLLTEQLAAVAESVPADSVRHALGVGRPDHVLAAAALGYNSFDCSLPTRDARRNRLYMFLPPYPGTPLRSGESFYRTVYILDDRYHADFTPIDRGCDCPCCRVYSRAYLHHLFKVGDATAERLASLHNLRFYTRLMAALGVGSRAAVSDA